MFGDILAVVQNVVLLRTLSRLLSRRREYSLKGKNFVGEVEDFQARGRREERSHEVSKHGPSASAPAITVSDHSLTDGSL